MLLIHQISVYSKKYWINSRFRVHPVKNVEINLYGHVDLTRMFHLHILVSVRGSCELDIYFYCKISTMLLVVNKSLK
jgi:hypothetical protein